MALFAALVGTPCAAHLVETQRVEMIVGGLTQADDSHALVVELDAAKSARGARPEVLAWSPLIDATAERFDVDRALLMAVMDVESGGNPSAVSPKGARGLMQLMPATGARHGAKDLFDPAQNVTAAAHLLDSLLASYGEVSLALAAYNAGEGAVKKYGGAIPPYAETQQYVQRVIRRIAYYQRQK
jgi:soluble lytic murein transglycosylase-like protein